VLISGAPVDTAVELSVNGAPAGNLAVDTAGLTDPVIKPATGRRRLRRLAEGRHLPAGLSIAVRGKRLSVWRAGVVPHHGESARSEKCVVATEVSGSGSEAVSTGTQPHLRFRGFAVPVAAPDPTILTTKLRAQNVE